MVDSEATRSRRGIDSLADAALLKKVWKRYLRYKLQNPRPQEFELGHDPLEYAAVDWDLDGLVFQLRGELLSGSFRASSPEIIRGGKGSGLSRPLAFLSPKDLLAYKTVIQVAQGSLMRHMPAWTSFGRQDSKKTQMEAATDYSWFTLWLQQDKRRWRIIRDCPFIVVTDIANFFPYVPLAGVASHVLTYSNLNEASVQLLVHMLESFGGMTDYRRTSSVGVPQDGFDCSRVLAHTYLAPLDREFQKEGDEGRYSRYVDDVVIGVRSEDEGLRVIQRAQFALEGLGLYPNAAKTEIVLTVDIDRRWFRDANDYLGEVDQRFEAGEPEDLKNFNARLQEHLDHREKNRYWTQVLKRFVTLARKLRSPYLCDKWMDVVVQSPTSARHIVDYLSTFPLDADAFERVLGYYGQHWNLYDDVDLLVIEYVNAAPNLDENDLRENVGEWALRIARQQYGTSPRRSAAAIVSVGKFGRDEHLLSLVPLIEELPSTDNVARQQAAVVLAGGRHFSPLELFQRLQAPSVEGARHIRFLRALWSGEQRATGIARDLMKPAKRKDPFRYVFRARSIFLAPLISHGSPLTWISWIGSWRGQISAMKPEFRDQAAERWLGI